MGGKRKRKPNPNKFFYIWKFNIDVKKYFKFLKKNWDNP